MTSILLVAGVVVAMFVAYNIGGSTTGPAFGPAVGADAISKPVAAALMGVFFFIGAWTLGRNVVTKLGTELVVDTGISRSSPQSRCCFSSGSHCWSGTSSAYRLRLR